MNPTSADRRADSVGCDSRAYGETQLEGLKAREGLEGEEEDTCCHLPVPPHPCDHQHVSLSLTP